jgi:hypothetical protein
MLNGTYSIKILPTDRSLLFLSLSDVHVEAQKTICFVITAIYDIYLKKWLQEHE